MASPNSVSESLSAMPEPTFKALFRRASAFVPTGVAVLLAAGTRMTVSTLQFVSFDPALISVCLACDSRSGNSIVATGSFHARLLRCGEEGLTRGEGPVNGKGLLELECDITRIVPAGDHTLVLAKPIRVSLANGTPLVYWRRGLHHFRPLYPFLASGQAFEEFVAAWEKGTLAKGDWSHAAHIAVAACYAVRDRAHALERMRIGICHYNEAVGTANTSTSGYHETLTCFWFGIVAEIVKTFSDPWEAACHAVERVGEDRDLHYLYYSFDVVRDPVARATWIPPNLAGPYRVSIDTGKN